MARKPKKEYDWLNDPFDEKKAAREREEARMGAGMKAALGCGCVFAVAGFFLLLVVGGVQVLSLVGA